MTNNTKVPPLAERVTTFIKTRRIQDDLGYWWVWNGERIFTELSEAECATDEEHAQNGYHAHTLEDALSELLGDGGYMDTALSAAELISAVNARISVPTVYPVEERVCILPNGCTLYRTKNEAGGYIYTSDEVGQGIQVWDTSLVDVSTLLAALAEECRREAQEKRG